MSIVKISLIILAALLVLPLILTLLGGPLVKQTINSHGSSFVGREMHVDDASVNFFTGSVQLDSLLIGSADADSVPFLSVHQFQARLSLWRLLTGVIDLDQVDVDQLRLDVQQRDTVFNCSDIIAHLIDDADSDPLPLVLRHINIHNSYIRYQDLLVHSDFRISDFSLFIPGVDLRDINTSLGLQLTFVDGGALTTHLDYDDRRQTYNVDLQLSGFNLQSLLPYTRQSIALGAFEGVLNLNLQMQGSLKHILDFNLRGSAGVKGLNLLDAEGRSMLACDTVDVGVRDLDLPQNRIELSRMVFDRPSIRIEYGRDSLDNFSRLVAQAAANASAEADRGEGVTESDAEVSFNGRTRDLRLIIDQLRIQGASLSYRDESLAAEPFVYDLTNVMFDASRFSLTGVNHITASAQLGQEGRFRFQYEGPITDLRNMKFQLLADRIAFADFSPYTVQMFGNEVTQGQLSVTMQAQTRDGRLSGQNRFILNDPKVEKKRHDVTPEMNIPFRAGMYILTDRDNVCDLDIPVSGNIDDPQFSYKRLIFRTLGKLIVKVCTSPFRSGHSGGGASLSAEELLQLDARPLDDIRLDSISSDLLRDE